ncbi:hypothetical protein GJ496_005950 [Pomphorhynchus laevis]|nr:hypothetical protein GJ496_005950 [Pomphorhynchus laevis]
MSTRYWWNVDLDAIHIATVWQCLLDTDELSPYQWHPNRRRFAQRHHKINNEKYVVEASPTINLTTEEKHVLQLGLNFAIAPLE